MTVSQDLYKEHIYMRDIFKIDTPNRNSCPICAQNHAAHVGCRWDALKQRVVRLLQSNSMIPGLIEANKEAMEISKTFQKVARDTSKAIFLCEKVIMEFPNRHEIWGAFKKRLGEEWEEPTSLGTEETQHQEEPLISKEIKDNPSTETTQTGENIVQSTWQ